MRKVLFYPDVQVPYHNSLQVRALNRFLAYWQPDECIIMGDFMDFPQPSTWNKGTAAEYQGSVFQDCETGKKILADIRTGYLGVVKFLVGNHDERPDVYLAKYAPSLAGSGAFKIDTLLDFSTYGIELAPDYYEWHPGWYAAHGHLGISLSDTAGKTALGAAQKIDASIVIGHTHRLGIISETRGRDGNWRSLTGVEVGHVMDMRPGRVPDWLKGSFANWQSGFAVAYAKGDYVAVYTIPMSPDGTFIFEGVMHDAYGPREPDF